MKEIEINNIKETIIERTDYPIERCREILKDETTAILGYGPQGKGQGLNMRDQGFKVIIGLRRSCKPRNDHPIPSFRCGSNSDVAHGEG